MKDGKIVVFFGCSMRGSHEVVSREELAQFPVIIEELGYELASKHQTEVEIIVKEDKLEDTYIHDRDYGNLLGSDVGVFEISDQSGGAGAEISDMVHEKKPVLCLFKGNKKLVSAYLRGKQGSKFVKTPYERYSYETLEDAKAKIKRFVDKHLEGVTTSQLPPKHDGERVESFLVGVKP